MKIKISKMIANEGEIIDLPHYATKGAAGFDTINMDYANQKRGLYTHANFTTQKSDCFPQPELLDLLMSF